MQCRDPVLRLSRIASHDRMVAVERVSAASKLCRAAAVLEDVVARVIDARAERWPGLVSSAVWLKTTSRMTSMPAGAVPDHVAKFIHGLSGSRRELYPVRENGVGRSP